MSRREALLNKGRQPEMPPLRWGEYIIDHLFELGPTMTDGPVTFEEIGSWMRLTETSLSPFEVQLLRRLSREYLGESYAATKRDRAAPYAGSVANQVADRKAVQKAIDRELDRFLA